MRPLNALVPQARPRRDPAPSRLRYRLARWWLDPRRRAAITVWLPLVVAALALWQVGSRPLVRDAVLGGIATIAERIRSRPEFMLSGLSIVGGSPEVRAEVAGVVGMSFPVSSLAFDLDAVRARVEAVPAVERARVSVMAGNLLMIRIVERVPAAVLRRGEALFLVDDDGRTVARLAMRAARADLPLLAGEGAEHAVAEALALVRAAARAAPRLRGLVRVGERRWDAVLDRGQRILLPEAGAVAALERVMALDRADGLLARDASHVDLRDGGRPVLRLGPDAAAALAARRTKVPGQET